jgi:DNA (cytosine-5)-methyltransferase 1
MAKDQMSFGSLFAGIGGIDLGLERAGMKCEWQVEIDPFCQKVLAKHWPEVARYEDIREVGSHNLSSVDLICGGFPCQPHSLAGKREASGDERDLWGEMFRVICEVKPQWVLAENVPGLLSSEAGRFFGRVLRDLASVGYDVEWESLPAAAFGAHHSRDRVFLVANSTSISEFNGVFREADEHSYRNAGSWPKFDSRMARVANGVPSRVDRLRSLGNAVVPAVAEWIGRQING